MSETELNDQAYSWDDDAEWTYEATVEARPFREAIEAASAVANECVLTISPEGLSYATANVPNVLGAAAESDCIAAADGTLRVCVTLDGFTKADSWPVSGRNDHSHQTLRVQYDGGEGADLVFEGDGLQRLETVAHDPADAFPTTFEPPEVEFDYDATLPTPVLRGFFVMLGESDAQTVTLTPMEGALHGTAKDRNRDELHDATVSVPGLSDGAGATYHPDFLTDIAAALPTRGDARLRFGADSLLRVDVLDITLVLAPRIADEDGA